LTGQALGPREWLLRGEGRLARLRALGIGVPKDKWVPMPVVAFYVEHPGVGAMLIDTGFHPSVAVDPSQSLGRVGTLTFKDIEMNASQAVPAQLRALEVDPGQVNIVVMTHLHIDHASGMSEFPEATFVFSSREWEAASSQGRLHGYMTRQFDHAFDYRTLNFDGRDADSFASFGRAFDLLGDGSMRLVFTPGHTHGHLSVILRLRDREALIAGDAIYTMQTLRDSHLPTRMEDAHRFQRSLREIQLYAEQTPDALIVPGHDMEAWRSLEPVYD
jgi:glyoxylase-like metal-dependent hydrolase (beta-lactamase superfamily II)